MSTPILKPIQIPVLNSVGARHSADIISGHIPALQRTQHCINRAKAVPVVCWEHVNTSNFARSQPLLAPTTALTAKGVSAAMHYLVSACSSVPTKTERHCCHRRGAKLIDRLQRSIKTTQNHACFGNYVVGHLYYLVPGKGSSDPTRFELTTSSLLANLSLATRPTAVCPPCCTLLQQLPWWLLLLLEMFVQREK